MTDMAAGCFDAQQICAPEVKRRLRKRSPDRPISLPALLSGINSVIDMSTASGGYIGTRLAASCGAKKHDARHETAKTSSGQNAHFLKAGSAAIERR
jgi:hypothetical protein